MPRSSDARDPSPDDHDQLAHDVTTGGLFAPQHAVLFDHGSVIDLHATQVGTNSAQANAINNHGQIVGLDATGHGFLYQNGKSVDVMVNDRGPYFPGRVIDLSVAAAKQLDIRTAGLAKVSIETLPTEQIAALPATLLTTR